MFNRDRIVLPIIKKAHGFSFVAGGCCSNDKTSFLISSDALFLLAVMNSSLTEWLVRMDFPVLGDPWAGGRIEYRVAKVKTIPIPKAGPTDKARLTKLAERAAKQAEAEDAAGLRATEREIDEIVYRLFDLTPDEIAHIEKALINVGRAGPDGNSDRDDEE